MPLLISFEIWSWVNRHRREKVKTKSCFKYSRERAAEWHAGGSGGRRGELPEPEQLALFALLEASVCFPSNVHWIYIGGKPFWASELRTRLGARSRQTAASFPSSCPAVRPFALWHSRGSLSGMISSIPALGWQDSSSRSRSPAGCCRCVSTL